MTTDERLDQIFGWYDLHICFSLLLDFLITVYCAAACMYVRYVFAALLACTCQLCCGRVCGNFIV
jgi:hypothetical protein